MPCIDFVKKYTNMFIWGRMLRLHNHVYFFSH